jgi:hypothetical protein
MPAVRRRKVDGMVALQLKRYRMGSMLTSNGRAGPRPWKNAFAEGGGPTSIVRLWQGLHAYPGTQARIACSSGPTPMIATTRFML